MDAKLQAIREYIHSEIKKSTKCDSWFWDEHIVVVERLAQELLKKYPEASEETVLLSVWLHDFGRAYGHDEDHDLWSANFSKTFLQKKGFSDEIIEGVAHACLTHSADERQPETPEAKILATADALSHFDGGFYLRIFFAWKDRMNDYPAMRKKLIAKIERDFKQKIFFPEAKAAVEPLYHSWKTALSSLKI